MCMEDDDAGSRLSTICLVRPAALLDASAACHSAVGLVFSLFFFHFVFGMMIDGVVLSFS